MNNAKGILREAFRRLWMPVVLTAVIGSAVMLIGDHFMYEWQNPAPSEYVFQTINGDACSVAVVPLASDFSTLGASTNTDDVVTALQHAASDSGIKGVILQIDSPGGTPVSGEMVASVLKRLDKPSVALIREEGTSAAYWAATGAEHIIADADSIVGSIGVTSSYLDYAQQDQKNGTQFVQLSIGQFKDIGNPDKPLTDAEKALIERDLKIIYSNFVNAVATNRHLPLATVQALADGSSMTGQMALSSHLVDQLGDIETARQYLQQRLGSSTPAILCQTQN